MKDNNPDDKYFYEIVVETGPLGNHSTTSNIYFIMAGDDDETGARCFTDPDRHIFQSGGLDPFLLATEKPLGELQYIRIWNDSSGLGELGSWWVTLPLSLIYRFLT